MNNRIDDYILGSTQAEFDYNLGYISKFLEMHKAPENVQDAFEKISRAFIDYKHQSTKTP